jgi:hypothetical protein
VSSAYWDSLDSVQQCLDYFKFGPSFKKWTSILFQNISSCVLNTGWSTEFFSVERGVRQGSLIFENSFNMLIEVLMEFSDPSIII